MPVLSTNYRVSEKQVRSTASPKLGERAVAIGVEIGVLLMQFNGLRNKSRQVSSIEVYLRFWKPDDDVDGLTKTGNDCTVELVHLESCKYLLAYPVLVELKPLRFATNCQI